MPVHVHFGGKVGQTDLLARDVFLSTNESLRYCHDVHLSVHQFVCLSGTGVHYDHTVHVSMDLSLWLNSVVFWALWHQIMSTYSQPLFHSSAWKRGEVWMDVHCVQTRQSIKH